MNRYRECNRCGDRAKIPDGVSGDGFVGWGERKGSDLCSVCLARYTEIVDEMDTKKNEALNKFLKL